MKFPLKAAVVAVAAALVAGATVVPAQADPKPENPGQKTYTSRTVACEWKDPDSGKEKFSKLTVKFLLIDGEAFLIRGYSIRGKRPGNAPILFSVLESRGPLATSVTPGVQRVGEGVLDERGRASETLKHIISGDTLTLGMATARESLDVFDPSTWAPDLCTAEMEIPYAPAG